jgi:hypothetical protein
VSSWKGESGSAVLVYRGGQCSCFQLLSSSGLTCVMSTLDELLVKAATRRADDSVAFVCLMVL